MNPKAHWERVYSEKAPAELSWYQAHARTSLALIERAGVAKSASILDVGGGDSTLVDDLVGRGYRGTTVLDLSAAALDRARARLGANAGIVTWREADILDAALPPASIDVWHDRAVFHFLTQPDDRARYIAQVEHAVRPGGHVIVATFAEDGPSRCSGLPVERYSAAELHRAFGVNFQLVASEREMHLTPSGARQPFAYCSCVYVPIARPGAGWMIHEGSPPFATRAHRSRGSRRLRRVSTFSP